MTTNGKESQHVNRPTRSSFQSLPPSVNLSTADISLDNVDERQKTARSASSQSDNSVLYQVPLKKDKPGETSVPEKANQELCYVPPKKSKPGEAEKEATTRPAAQNEQAVQKHRNKGNSDGPNANQWKRKGQVSRVNFTALFIKLVLSVCSSCLCFQVLILTSGYKRFIC